MRSSSSPAGPDGAMSPVLLAAASLLEVDELYAMGGAQAVAALAHGTETIERVDKIVGPGNSWVTAAKLHVLGACAIDLPAGPSEVLRARRPRADPRLVAIDLLCQAEHGPNSPAVLVTTDPGWRTGWTPRSSVSSTGSTGGHPGSGARRPRDGGDRRQPRRGGRLRPGIRRRARHHPHLRPRRTPRPSPPPDRSMSVAGRRSPPATMPPVPTTSSPPVASPPHTARSR